MVTIRRMRNGNVQILASPTEAGLFRDGISQLGTDYKKQLDGIPSAISGIIIRQIDEISDKFNAVMDTDAA